LHLYPTPIPQRSKLQKCHSFFRFLNLLENCSVVCSIPVAAKNLVLISAQPDLLITPWVQLPLSICMQ